MDRTFAKFLRRGIDLAPLGAARREDNTPYFCTPKGASVFGWAGVDGIHFCFVRGFGGTVFAVSPMDPPECVRPVARDFADFLRLLLACGDTAALEQSWMWDEAQFDGFLRENPPTAEQKAVIAEIAETFRLTPMERPWAYIRKLQSSFDSSKIKYTEDYYDLDMNPAAEPTPPAWKVYYEGNFRGHSGKDRAGQEIPLGGEFDWAGRHWVVPAAYSCAKGVVVDFCMRVEPEEIRAFLEKWKLYHEEDPIADLTREQQIQMEWENPLLLRFAPVLELNGKTLRMSHGCSVSFNPCVPEGVINELEAKWVVEHYGLDASFGWVISRYAFPWGTRRPDLNTLSVDMERQPDRLPGPHFTAHRAGDSFSFAHPVSGTEYTLTVRELERRTLPERAFGAREFFYPRHTTAMTYTLSPEPAEEIAVADCAQGERPLPIAPPDPMRPAAVSCAAVIGVIGGADGPTAVSVAGKAEGKLRASFSSLHFEPVEGDVEWRAEFSVRRSPAGRFRLL